MGLGYDHRDGVPDIKIDLAKCEGAGVCAQICPMNENDMVEVNGKQKAQPRRAQDCMTCMACVNGYPYGACTFEA